MEALRGWRVHFVVPVLVDGQEFVASLTCHLPSIPPVGATVAISQDDRALRPAVDDVTCWLDGFVGVRLTEISCVSEEMLCKLEREGWSIESMAGVDFDPRTLLDDL
ncbi:MAG: hypothetical protein U0R50_16080 [Gaiellales bacterium]